MKNLMSFRRIGAFLPDLLLTTILLMSVSISSSQNVGIGVENPTEKLQVGGIVHSLTDGFRFPDGTVQNTASRDFEPAQAGDNRLFAVLQCFNPSIPGPFSFDTLEGVSKVISYQWGMTSVDAGGGQSDVTVSNIEIMKNIDIATPGLLHRALEGENMPELRIFFYREVNGDIQAYYSVFLLNVIIRAFSQAMVYTGGEAYSHVDIIMLEYEEANWTFIGFNQVTWPVPIE